MQNILIKLYVDKLNNLNEQVKNKKYRILRAELQQDLYNLKNLNPNENKLFKYYANLLNSKYSNISNISEEKKYKKNILNLNTNLQKKFKLEGSGIDKDAILILTALIIKIALDKNFNLCNKDKLFINTNFKKLSGAGLFDTFKTFVSKTYDNITDRFKGKRLDGFNRESTRTIEKYGQNIIKSFRIAKKPIHSILDKFINVISIGKWKQLKNRYGFDKLMHLCLIVNLENGTKIFIEKVDAVTISTVDNISSDETQYLDLDAPPNLTLSDLIQRARDYIKNDKLFFDYDPWTNNCQVFLTYFLNSIGKYGPTEKNFLFQDVSQIADLMPNFTKKIMKGVTDIGQISNRFLGKGGSRVIGGANKMLTDLKSRVPVLEQEAYKFLGTIPKMIIPVKTQGRPDIKKLRAEWEITNRPEMLKVLNMGPSQRQIYKEQKIKEYNDWKSKPEIKKQFDDMQIKQSTMDIKNVSKAKKYFQLNKLLDALKLRKEEAQKIDNPEIRQNLINQYNHDTEQVKNYNFYAVNNPLLRDQLEAQYLKMFNNMIQKPKVYGFLPEGNIKRTDPNTIKYVYEHYGKPDFNWDTFINDSLPSLFNEGLKFIPGIGQIYAPIGDALIEQSEKDNAAKYQVSEEQNYIPDIDYNKGYELFQKPETQMQEEFKTMDTQESDLIKQRQDLLGSGYKKKLLLKQSTFIGDKLNINWKKINKKYWNTAMNIELEHIKTVNNNLLTIGKIARDHLNENINYYIELQKLENK